MTVTTDSFRKDFAKIFGDEDVYSDDDIKYWIQIGTILFNVERWGPSGASDDSPPKTTYDYGLELFVAHNLILMRLDEKAAAAGGVPGMTPAGPTASKSVGPVSISYDTSSSLELDAGHWNLTTYGRRLIRLIRMIGSGPVQVGIGLAPPFTVGAWFGPWPYPQQGNTGFG